MKNVLLTLLLIFAALGSLNAAKPNVNILIRDNLSFEKEVSKEINRISIKFLTVLKNIRSK